MKQTAETNFQGTNRNNSRVTLALHTSLRLIQKTNKNGTLEIVTN